MKNDKMIKVLYVLFLWYSSNLNAQALQYKYRIDLTKCTNDEIKVTLDVPNNQRKKNTFMMPRMVPGTYKIYDFGRFIRDFKAFDTKGVEMAVKHNNANIWNIDNGQVARVEYVVEDTWDSKKQNMVFEPAGTSFVANKEFILNNHTMFGFFENEENSPIELYVTKPANFYASTALEQTAVSKNVDVFKAKNYYYFQDGPIMYCEPDTAWLMVGKTKVLVSVYSQNKVVKASDLAKNIAPTLDAQRKYLGGELPVDKYAFLIHLNPQDEVYKSSASGALEHSFCSVYALYENDDEESIARDIRDIAAHEFFHIVTPLNIHSEEIHYFNFMKPKMSKHLWLYEGAIEYFSHHAQVKYRETTLEHFMSVISEKIQHAEEFNQEVSFTKMSKGVLDEFENQYQNVYEKGMLIALCLDLKLIELTKGKINLQSLMKTLAKEYGRDKPFKDDELFDRIAELTHPEIRTFFKKYVEGTDPLPIKESIRLAGIEYKDKGFREMLSPIGGLENAGAFGFDFAAMKCKVEDDKKLNNFGRDSIGFKTGDLIMEWNDIGITMQNANEVINNLLNASKEGSPINVLVLRNNKAVYLKTTLRRIPIEIEHFWAPVFNASKEELNFRRLWLGFHKVEGTYK